MMGAEPSTASDAEIVHGSFDDPHRFGVIFDRHFDAVHGYLARRGGHSVADELSGEIFRVAFERRRSFDLDHPSARPWLYGIAANVLRRHWRKAGRRDAAYRRLSFRQAAGDATDDADIDAAIDARRHAAALATALDGLARRDRETLLLHVWEDLSYAEVGTALGIPVGTVRSRINRARRRLRTALEAENGHSSSMLPRPLTARGPQAPGSPRG